MADHHFVWVLLSLVLASDQHPVLLNLTTAFFQLWMNFLDSQSVYYGSDESLHPHFHQISPQLHYCRGLQRSTSSPHLKHQKALDSLQPAYAVRSLGDGVTLTLIEPLCQCRLSSHNCTGRLLGSRVQQFRERACEQSRRSSLSDRLRAQKWCNSCWAGRFTAEARLKCEDRSVDFALLPLPHAVWPPGGLNLELRGLSQLVPPYKGPFCCLHQLFHEFIYNVNTCFPSKRCYLFAFSRNLNSNPCVKYNLSNLIGFRHRL